MPNYAGDVGEAGEAGNCYTASFAATVIFQDTRDQIPELGLGAQNSVGMRVLRVTTDVQILGARIHRGIRGDSRKRVNVFL